MSMMSSGNGDLYEVCSVANRNKLASKKYYTVEIEIVKILKDAGSICINSNSM